MADPQVYYLESPVTVCNESLDLIGREPHALGPARAR